MCWKPWCNALLLHPYLLQTSLWSQKPPAWCHWEFLPLFTRWSAVSTAKSFDGRLTQPRWLRTVFLCVWRTVGMPFVYSCRQTAVDVIMYGYDKFDFALKYLTKFKKFVFFLMFETWSPVTSIDWKMTATPFAFETPTVYYELKNFTWPSIGVRMSRCWLNFPFWVNYPFKNTVW